MKINPIHPNIKKVALLAVKEAGKILRKNFRKSIKIKTKGDLSFVTNVDIEADKIITKIIKRNFPSHNIVSEESGGKFGKEFTWIVDPLDGTRNYILGFPFFSVSLTLLKVEKPVLSVVFNPMRGELYSAEKGKGAFLNRKKIRVNKTGDLSTILLSFNKGNDLMSGLRVLIKIAPHIHSFRFLGSANLEICQVAAGKIEGYLVSKPFYNDAIIGAFIVEEAGGKVTDFKGKKYTRDSKNLLVTNGKIHNQLLKLLK